MLPGHNISSDSDACGVATTSTKTTHKAQSSVVEDPITIAVIIDGSPHFAVFWER